MEKSSLGASKRTAVPASVSDFRPIALLSFLSKVLEKIVHTQVLEYLRSKKIFDPLQTGFRQYNSTQTAFLKLTEDIHTGIDSGKKLLTILLLFDFSKEFDTISPTKLLIKLSNMGFSRAALVWIKSYIVGRAQRVVSRTGGQSDWLNTNLGVPQISVLGPLYINDLSDVLNSPPTNSPTNCNNITINRILYADDLQIYIQTTRDGTTENITQLEAAAHRVSTWAETSGFRRNAGKTKAIIFGSDYNVNYVNELQFPSIQMGNGVIVPLVDTVTNLGVVMTSKLSWKPHVEHITKQANKALYSLKCFKSCTTEALRKQLATALVLPHIDNCSIVLLDATGELSKKFQRAQNSCVRYVTGVRRDEHITQHRLRLDWIDVEERRQYFTAVMMYKIIRIGQPPYLHKLLYN